MTRVQRFDGNGMEWSGITEIAMIVSFVDSFIIDWLLLLLQIILLRVPHLSDEQILLRLSHYFFFFFPLTFPQFFFFFYFRFWEHAVPCIRDRKWIESALLRKILRCTMRCHDVSSSCLRSRSSIEVFWEWFFFFSFHTSNAQKNAFPCAPTWYTIRVYIYITLETFFISTHTRFLSIVYFVHIIIIILRYERHLDFYQGILRISYSSNLFFNCVLMHLSFTKTVAIAIDSIRFEENRISNSKRAWK